MMSKFVNVGKDVVGEGFLLIIRIVFEWFTDLFLSDEEFKV
jgi:hypothetical protein